MVAGKTNRPVDVIELLRADHRRIEALFGDFEEARENYRKVTLAQKICAELAAHLAAAEEVFYPALYRTLNGKGHKLAYKIALEHASLIELIRNLSRCPPQDVWFDAHLTVLRDYVRRHFRLEKDETMPMAQRNDLDLYQLAQAITSFKKANSFLPLEGQEEAPKFAA